MPDKSPNSRVLMLAIVLGVLLIPLVMSVGTALYLSRDVGIIEAQIELLQKTIDDVKGQATRVEEEQKKRTSNVAKVQDLEERVKQLEGRRRGRP